MTLPRPLRREATDRLARPVEPGDESAPGEPAPAPPSAVAPVEAAVEPAAAPSVRHPRALLGAVKRRARAEAKTRFHDISRRAVVAGGVPEVAAEAAAARAEIAQLRDELATLYDELRPLSVELRLGRREVRDHVEVNRVNLELLKSEVRAGEQTLQELGMAFAPGTGLASAGIRFAELREAVNSLERRLRNLAISPAGTPTALPAPPAADPDAVVADVVPVVPTPEPAAATGAASTGTASTTASTGTEVGERRHDAPTSALFNYVGFERRFRGDPEVILANLAERYSELLSAHQPVVDIGCGRGELLEMLAGQGVEVIGVEPDPGMVAEGRARGITVYEAYASDWLREQPDHSLGSIFTAHVVEHLALDVLIEMLELAQRKLKPGGVFIAETPNPASLIVLGNSYILDPTHVLPLHPSLLSFLFESAGYRDIRLRFHAPATGYHLAHVESAADPALAEQVNGAFDRLNEVLFGPQEYAVIATAAE